MTTAIKSQFTTADRCDRCGAQAYVRVTLTSGGELLFCAHHGREHSEKLRDIAITIHDETSVLSSGSDAGSGLTVSAQDLIATALDWLEANKRPMMTEEEHVPAGKLYEAVLMPLEEQARRELGAGLAEEFKVMVITAKGLMNHDAFIGRQTVEDGLMALAAQLEDSHNGAVPE